MEAPSYEDIAEEELLSGMVGKEFGESLAKAGLHRGKLFIVSVIACLPKQGRTEGDVKRAVKCCRPLLLNQLAAIPEDTPTLACGKHAAAALTGSDRGVMNARGFIRSEFKLPRLKDEDD